MGAGALGVSGEGTPGARLDAGAVGIQGPWNCAQASVSSAAVIASTCSAWTALFRGW